jgi:hypothetical protein
MVESTPVYFVFSMNEQRKESCVGKSKKTTVETTFVAIFLCCLVLTHIASIDATQQRLLATMIERRINNKIQKRK